MPTRPHSPPHIMLAIVLCLSLIAASTQSAQPQFKDCNFTDYRFHSEYTLGKQDELNKTFSSLQFQMNIQDVNYSPNAHTKFTISGIRPVFHYLDSKQKAQIMGNDTIVIDGGNLEVDLTFNWTKKDFIETQGTGEATCLSNEIIFAKQLEIERGYLLYEVLDYYNVSFPDSKCKLTRYTPANLTSVDLDAISKMLNGMGDDKQSVRQELEDQIDRKYFTYLNNSLYSERHYLNDSMTYSFNSPKPGKSITVNYQVLPTGIDVEKDGISYTFVTEIRNYEGWECGATIPHTHLDKSKYGGTQEFVSFSVFQNTIKYAIERGVFRTQLHNDGWSSNMFQFYAGDLYEVIPHLAQKYAAGQKVTGVCQAITDGLKVYPYSDQNHVVVRVNFNCSLMINQTEKIIDINLQLFNQIGAKFNQVGKVDFYVDSTTYGVELQPISPYELGNVDLAKEIIQATLNNLHGEKVFLSGWAIDNMNYPQFKIHDQEYVLFYDSTHIGEQQLEARQQ